MGARENMGMRGAFRVAACIHMSLRRGATLGDIGSSPERLERPCPVARCRLLCNAY